jgi:hypothetical protein
MADGRWQVAGGRWQVAGGWWLVAGGRQRSYFNQLFNAQIEDRLVLLLPKPSLPMADGFFRALFCRQPWHFENISQLYCLIQPSGYFFTVFLYH